MSNSEYLLHLARRCDVLKPHDLAVTYQRGQGYRLTRDGQTYARFQTYAAGERWLNDLARDHIANWANLRWGTPFQRGKFKESNA